MKKNLTKRFVIVLALLMVVSMSGCSTTKATVQADNGPETLSVSEICDFSSRYLNRPIEVTAKVENVDGPYIFTDTNIYSQSNPRFMYYEVDLSGGWIVYVDEDDPIIQTVNVGDTIAVDGYVMDAWVSVTICGLVDGNWSAEATSVRIV